MRDKLLNMSFYLGSIPVYCFFNFIKHTKTEKKDHFIQGLALSFLVSCSFIIFVIFFAIHSLVIYSNRNLAFVIPLEISFYILFVLLGVCVIIALEGIISALLGRKPILKLYTKFKLFRMSFIMMLIQIVALLSIILMTIHASSLTQGDIDDSKIVMLYDDMGSVPRCVFALGFYRETLMANERWGADSVAIQPLTESNLNTAFSSNRLVYIAGHGTKGCIILIDGDMYWPKDIRRNDIGDRLQYVYISCCDSGILHDEWQVSLDPAQVKTFDRLSLVIEHIYWLILDGPKIINELE